MRPHDPALCVTVTGATTAELRAARDQAAGADLVEVRLDHAERPDVAGVLQGRRTPVLVTCRAAWEGGRFTGSEAERQRLLEDAIALGAEFVDVEASAPFAGDLVARTGGRGIVLSFHDFDGPGKDLAGQYRAMRAAGAETVKLAVTARRLEDTLPLFDLGRAAAERGERFVLLAMGPAGWATRILTGRLGNRWSYAGNAVAPGQIPADRLLREFRYRRIRPDAALYGVVGRPIGHSRSPLLHNAAFAALGLNAAYLPLEAADAGDFVAFARGLGLHGASITAPFKRDLMAAMDEIDPLAARTGAVNTLVVRDGRWIGTNTDIEGFLAPLANRLRLPGLRATVLGAGGAARGVAVGLLDRGARVTIAARRPEAAEQLAADLGASAGAFPPAAGSWDLLVNATTAGSGAAGINPMGAAPLDGRLVYDLVYEPDDTPLLQAARAAGCDTIGGMAMLIAQAERQFECWTGQRPPAGLFADAATPRPPAGSVPAAAGRQDGL